MYCQEVKDVLRDCPKAWFWEPTPSDFILIQQTKTDLTEFLQEKLND